MFYGMYMNLKRSLPSASRNSLRSESSRSDGCLAVLFKNLKGNYNTTFKISRKMGLLILPTYSYINLNFQFTQYAA